MGLYPQYGGGERSVFILKGKSLFKSDLFWASNQRPTGAQSTSGAAFLGITPSVRSYALGQANALTALGAEAVGANPANLGLMPNAAEVYSSYSTLIDGTQFENISAAYDPHDVLDGLGVSLTRLYSGGFAGADTSGNLIGSSFSGGDTEIAVSASAHPTENLRLGITGKLAQSAIAGYDSNWTPAADLGMTYTLQAFDRPFSIAASLVNFGGTMKFINQADQLPEMINTGVAFPVGNFMGILEVNRLILEQLTQVSVGGEYRIGPVAFRLGYVEESQASNLALQDQNAMGQMLGGLSEGLGLDIGDLRIDYAMSEQAVDFGTTQRIALSLRWGGPSEHSEGAERSNQNLRQEPGSPPSQSQSRKDDNSDSDQADWLMVY